MAKSCRTTAWPTAKSTSLPAEARHDFLVDKYIILYYYILRKEEKKMKKVSINLPAEAISHIEWCKIKLQEKTPIRYTTTHVILYAIENLYEELFNKSNK